MFYKAVISKNADIIQAAIAYTSALAAISIHFSPAMASISLVASVFLSIVCFFYRSNDLKSTPWFIFIPAIIVVWQFLSGFLLPPMDGTMQKIIVRLPLLFMPVLYGFKSWNGKIQLRWLLIVSLFPMWLALASVVNYGKHFKFLNQMILESKPIPIYSQVYHIEFSIILAVTSLLGFVWLAKNRILRSTFLGNLLAISALLMVICLHILSVRTGMLAFWVGALSYSVFAIGVGRLKAKVLLIGLLFLVAISLLLPSVRNRLSNTMDDFKTVSSGGDLNNKSFGQRWEAWGASVLVISENPIHGVGLKGVEDALTLAYVKRNSKLDLSKRVMPHNQFLDLTVQSGLPAGVLLLLFVVFGIIWAFRHKNMLMIAALPALSIAMMFESTLERQAGVLFFVLVLCFAFTQDDLPQNEEGI